jgi:hypothetical protein
MAKISTIRVIAKSPVQKFSKDLDVTVDSTGIFRTTVPEELLESAERLKRVDRNSAKPEWEDVGIDYHRGKTRLAAKTLRLLEDFSQKAAEDHVACTVTEELILVYGTDNRVSFYKGKDGTIYPNGGYAPVYGKGQGDWFGNLDGHMKQSDFFQVGFMARVITKQTFTRSSGTKIRYTPEDGLENHHGSDVSWRAKLNGFTGIWFFDEGSREDGYELPEGLKEMPYTEEAAKFFYEVMIGICALADRIDSFFKDKERVLLAIKSGTKLLPGPTEKNEGALSP